MASRRPRFLRILHLYFLGEVLSPTLVAFLLCTFVMLMNQFFLLAEYAYKYGVPVGSLTRLFLLHLPHIVVLTLPMSLLIGLLVATARWAADSELVALSASGVSLRTLLPPVLFLSTAFGLLTTWFSFQVMPRGNQVISQTFFEIFRDNLLKNVRAREFGMRLLPGQVLYIHDIERGGDGDRWRGILLDPSPYARLDQRHEVYFAEEASPSVDLETQRLAVRLKNVTVHGTVPGNPKAYDLRTLEEFTLVVTPPSFVRRPEETGRSVREMTFAELVSRERDPGLLDPTLRRINRIEVHKRLAIPFACFVFAFFGLGAGAGARRGGRAFAFLVSLVVILVYYVTFYSGERRASMGDMPPWLAMWLGNLIFGALGIVFFYLRATEGRSIKALRRALHQVWARLGLLERIDRIRHRLRLRRPGTQLGRTHRLLRFPSLLDRYILREFTGILALTLFAMFSLWVVVSYFQYQDDFSRRQTPFATIVEFYLAWSPEILTYVLPMGVLATTVVCFSLFTRNNEITAMLVSGLSRRRIVAPAIAAGIVLTGLTFFLYGEVLPRSAEHFEALNNLVRYGSKPSRILPARWAALVGSRRFLHYNSFDRSRGVFYQPMLFEIGTERFQPVRQIAANRARWEGSALVLENGAQREFSPGGDAAYTSFVEMALPFVEPRQDFGREWRDPRHMASGELLAYINWRREHEAETRELIIELENKKAYPFITLVMVLLGLPFAFAIGKHGSLYGIGISILLGAAYWTTVVLATYLGKLGALPPGLAAWSPNLVFGLLSLVALYNVRS